MGWFRKINENGEDYKPIGNVITATSLSVSGPDLADGDVVRVMFTTDIAGSDTSTPLALTWNGGATPIPVKASKEGSLASVYAHEVATNIFKYISGYVTLEMMFDGTNLVIIGNPVVLSGSNYTIYADGKKVDNTTIYERYGITNSTGLNVAEREIAKYNEVVYIDFFVYSNSNPIKNGDVIGHITDPRFYPRKNVFLPASYGERFAALAYFGTAKIDTTGNITLHCNGSTGYGEVSVRGAYLLCQPVN